MGGRCWAPVCLAVVVCLVMVVSVDGQLKKKKTPRRRVGAIVKELEKNVTALWREVEMISQPVHVHIHGHSQLLEMQDVHPDHPHPDPHPHIHHDYDDDNDDDCHHHDHHDDRYDDDNDRHQHHHHHGKRYRDEDVGVDMNQTRDEDLDHDNKRDLDRKRDHDHNRDHKRDNKHDHKHNHKRDRIIQDEHKNKTRDRKDRNCHHDRSHKHHHDDHHHKHHHDHNRHQHAHRREDGHPMRHGDRDTHVHIHLNARDMESIRPLAVPSPVPREYRYARCDIVGNKHHPDTANIRGSVMFRQMRGEALEVNLSLEGFPIDHTLEGGRRHLRGLHGHDYGDMSDGCNGQGGHYNPRGVNHGGPEAETRHPGDFGNLELEENGTVRKSFNDTQASLFGAFSMLGRGLVIHAGEDDLGLKDDPASKRSGNAGPRIACCAVLACQEPPGIWS